MAVEVFAEIHRSLLKYQVIEHPGTMSVTVAFSVVILFSFRTRFIKETCEISRVNNSLKHCCSEYTIIIIIIYDLYNVGSVSDGILILRVADLMGLKSTLIF